VGQRWFRRREAAQCIDQVCDVEDSFFEQVADPFGMLFEQPHGVVRFDVLGQDQHPDAGVLGADLLGGGQAFVGVCGRHADVDDRSVGLGGADRVQQRGGVARLGGEHTFRLFKQVLGWTTPKIRSPDAADRWTWLIITCHARLRLARPLADDLRLPWERPAPPGRLTPARVRRGFRNIRATMPCPAGAAKPGKPGPGRPPGSKNRRAVPRHDVGKTTKREPTRRYLSRCVRSDQGELNGQWEWPLLRGENNDHVRYTPRARPSADGGCRARAGLGGPFSLRREKSPLGRTA
jgi:hypothetical protein